jgi:HAD superfamily hydrolase (TIGR01509 family)
VFDLDGILVDTEPLWADAKLEVTEAHGGRWRPQAPVEMLGMSGPEWAAFMHDELGVASALGQIIDGVVGDMAARFREQLPIVPGARAAVRRLASRWPLGLASSANRPLIDLVIHEAGLTSCFAVTLSTEEVTRGKPAPDAYLEVTRQMGAEPGRCAGIEDSTNGLRALKAAGLRTIAVPNREFPPSAEALASADAVISNLEELTFDVIDPL